MTKPVPLHSKSQSVLWMALLVAATVPVQAFTQEQAAPVESGALSQETLPSSWIDNQDHVLYKKELEIMQMLQESSEPEAPAHSMIVRARKLSSETEISSENYSSPLASLNSSNDISQQTEAQVYTKKIRACCGEPALIRAVQDARPLKFGSIEIRDDMPLALVSLKDTNLLSGPAPDFMTLTRVPLGTQVAIETRHEDWYRVITEDGIRGWVHSDVLLFGPDSRTLPTLYIKVRGYEPQSDRLDWEE